MFWFMRRARLSWPLFVAGAALLAACGGPPATGGDAGPPTLPPELQPTRADASRLLDQAAFGPTPAEVDTVRRIGAEAWIETQFALPVSRLPDLPVVVGDTCGTPSESNPEYAVCARDYLSPYQVQRRFFQNAVGASDQLRQRAAFALSQIFVMAHRPTYRAYATADYQQGLIDLAFGNFRDLIEFVTLNPAMGAWLDMVNSARSSAGDPRKPNENFARELLQLFTIGPALLNEDASAQTDVAGAPVAAYGQAEIEGFSRAFTGWTWPTPAGAVAQWPNPLVYRGRMAAVEAQHDVGTKTLLRGATLPAGQSAAKDLRDALDNVFQHPNVGPFIGRALIQHLVTSNPSPQYVARVARAFNDNGQGVRGDMKAVIRAVLLDAEARGEERTAPNYGRVRDPVLFMTAFLRALSGTTDGVGMKDWASIFRQPPYDAPSVFNFFSPYAALPGTELVAPEMQLLDEPGYTARANFAWTMTFGSGVAADASLAGATGTHVDLTSLAALASDPSALADRIGLLFMRGALSPDMKAIIVEAVSAVTSTSPLDRARTAVYLIASSPQYQEVH